MIRTAPAILMIGLAGAAYATEGTTTAAPADGVAASDAPSQVTTMTYEIFEAGIGHGDLPECPAALAGEGRFCRATMHHDALHVFAFSEDGDQPLQAVMEYPLDQIRFPD